MNLAALSIEKRAITYFAIFLILAGGIFCYFKLGQLEDPEFSVKTAVITTTYQGASAEQVELEITDRIETKLQEMVELKNVYSNSRPGLSIIKVDIKSNYWSDRLPQVWDVLRKKVRDIEPTLPPGAGKPKVGDDFGYVFGFLLAVSSDGYSYAELERYVKDMRKELSVVPGVARVDFWGVQEKRIYIDVSTSQLSALGLTAEQMTQFPAVAEPGGRCGPSGLPDAAASRGPDRRVPVARRHRRPGDCRGRHRPRRVGSHPRFCDRALWVRRSARPVLAP